MPCPSAGVARWSSQCPRASVVLRSLQCSSLSQLGLRVASTTIVTGLGLSLVPCPWSCRLGLVPRSEAPLCALQPSFRVVLAEAAGLKRLLDLSNCAPLTVGPLPGPPALHSLLSAGCLLCLETSSGEASASSLRFSWRPGAAGALTVILIAAASLREFFPLCLVLPLWGSATFLTFVPQLEALSESLTHSIPRSFLVVPLSASAVGFANALWLFPERALRLFFASVSLFDPVALSPLLRRVYADGFRHWCAFRSCGGASPHAFGSVGALGELRWFHLYRLTPDLVGLRQFAVCHWSSGRCFIFYCATFRTYSWRSFCQFHWLLRVPD